MRTEAVFVPTATGRVQGYVARPVTQELLPALLLIPADAAVSGWMKESARDLAGIGYEVLVVDLRQSRAGSAPFADERILAELSAAVRWLRRRPDVIPERLGVVGWGWGGTQALALAATTPLQACVMCSAKPAVDRSFLTGLRGTPVLSLQTDKHIEPQLRQAGIAYKSVAYTGAHDGFMDPARTSAFNREAADKAWVEIYNFLGKHVEDAPPATSIHSRSASALGEDSVASIFDIMLAVNTPSGVRGNLARELEKRPDSAPSWERVHANAALMAEAGKLLAARKPPRGDRSHWLAAAADYAASAAAIAKAAGERDYAASRRGLQELNKRCAACHDRHR